MKSINLLLVTLSAFFFISCENEPIDPALSSQINNPNNNNTPTTGIFKATFDGQVFQTSTVECVIQNGILLMNATRSPNDDSFGFIITGAAVGTFPAKDHGVIYEPANSGGFGYWAANVNNPNEDLGSVVISSIDMVNKKISGTFNFKGYWSDTNIPNMTPKNFTNGSFTNIPFLTEAITNDVFTANINGATFSNATIAVLETTIGGDDYISIGGARNNDSITITVKESLGVGNYTITGASTDVVQAKYNITNPVYNQTATMGLITITEKSATRIKGTFNFTTPNTPIPYIITNGNFDVEL